MWVMSSSMAGPSIVRGWIASRWTPRSAYRRAVSRSTGPPGGVMVISSSPSPAGRSSPGRGFAELRQRPGGPLDVQVEAVPAICLLDGAPVRRLRLPADHDWRVRLLHRPGPLDNVVKGDEAPRERGRGSGPELAHRGQVLVGAGSPIGERRAEGAQLRLHIADSNANDQPPFRQGVEGRQLLGQQDRLALGQHDHPDREPHPAGERRHEGQRHDGLQARLLGRVATCRFGVGREGDVISNPQRLEPDLLRAPGSSNQGVRIGATAAVQPEQRQLQTVRHKRLRQSRAPIAPVAGRRSAASSGSCRCPVRRHVPDLALIGADQDVA